MRHYFTVYIIVSIMPPKELGDKYRKHELRDHIYEIPGTYVGSIEKTPAEIYLFDKEQNTMVKKEITYVPAILKIFDEVIVNAIDQSTRIKMAAVADSKPVKNIWVTIDKTAGRITVMNDGDGIDIDKHPEHKIWIPELIFGQLLTSTNYDQNEERLVGGLGGFGAKLANIFSKEFIVTTVDHRRKKIYSQRFYDNMKQRDPANVKAYSKSPYTSISFTPDWERFGLKGMTDDLFELFEKRTYDACATTDATVSVYFNDNKLPAKSFEKYVELYLGPTASRPRVYEASEDGRWEVIATYSDHGVFEQVSFVNGINTIRGGKHVDYIVNQITTELVELVAKKQKKRVIKPQNISTNLMIFVKSLIVNPAFDSQSKETLTTLPAKFGSKFKLSEKFMDKLYKTGIIDKAVTLAEFQEDKKLAKTDGKKSSRITGIPKLDDANDAGTKKSGECTLILTEGDSAKALAVAGLSAITGGRNKFGIYPLRGKVLNVKDAAKQKISENAEISALKKILGLEQGKTYTSTDSLRYGSIMVMTDADEDGHHIRGLIFNVLQSLWPSLYKMPGFLTSLLTPIVKATHKSLGQVLFYNLSDFHKWREAHDGAGWSIKYYKGLGTSTSAEGKEYFAKMKRTVYKYTGTESDECIDLAFNKKRADDRKEWLTNFDNSQALDYKSSDISFQEFINKELIYFSIEDLARSIPNMMDGFKISTRKIMYGCLKKNLTKHEIRVAQLAGYISEVSMYHHGEASLQQAIIGMAQNFVGSNNINLLEPIGQFGTRLEGGSDSAAPRYIQTLLSQLSLKIYLPEDNPVLTYNLDDGVPVEATWYCPVVPMVVINGCLGIGTGFSTTIPQHNPTDVVRQCLEIISALDKAAPTDLTVANKVIDNVTLGEIKPWYLGFQGEIIPSKANTFISKGCWRFLDDQTLHITELPVGVWTQTYKEFLEELIASPSNKYVKNYKNESSEDKVNFTLNLNPNSRAKLEGQMDTELKLASSKNLSLTNMHLFNEKGVITRFNTIQEIIKAWAVVRLSKYHERKEWQINEMEETLKILSAKCRFIQEIIDGKIKVMNVKSKELEEQLIKGKYPKSKEGGKVAKRHVVEVGSPEVVDIIDEEVDDNEGGGGYQYLTKLPIYNLTFEKKQQLEKEASELNDKLSKLRAKPVQTIWREEINAFSTVWESHKLLIEERYDKGIDIKPPIKRKK